MAKSDAAEETSPDSDERPDVRGASSTIADAAPKALIPRKRTKSVAAKETSPNIDVVPDASGGSSSITDDATKALRLASPVDPLFQANEEAVKLQQRLKMQRLGAVFLKDIAECIANKTPVPKKVLILCEELLLGMAQVVYDLGPLEDLPMYPAASMEGLSFAELQVEPITSIMYADELMTALRSLEQDHDVSIVPSGCCIVPSQQRSHITPMNQ
jgi:hypothetical protein